MPDEDLRRYLRDLMGRAAEHGRLLDELNAIEAARGVDFTDPTAVERWLNA